MSGQHCENCDVKRETVHCYPRNVDRCCTWSEVAYSCRWTLSAFFKFFQNHFMTDTLQIGEKEILFPENCSPRIWKILETKSRETLRSSGNKIHCSPRDQSLSVIKYSRQYAHSHWSISVFGWEYATAVVTSRFLFPWHISKPLVSLTLKYKY